MDRFSARTNPLAAILTGIDSPGQQRETEAMHYHLDPSRSKRVKQNNFAPLAALTRIDVSCSESLRVSLLRSG